MAIKGLIPQGVSSPVPDLIRSGSEDGGSSVSTLSSFESSAHSDPAQLQHPHQQSFAKSTPSQPVSHVGGVTPSSPNRLKIPPAAPKDVSQILTSPLRPEPQRLHPHDAQQQGSNSSSLPPQNAITSQTLTGLAQAANYATLSQPSILTQTSIAGGLSQMSLSTNDAQSCRPPLPRTSSVLTARPVGPATVSTTSSASATPAAVVAEDPMAKATVIERLEKDVESPSCSSSGSGWNALESDTASSSPAIPFHPSAAPQSLSSSSSSSSAAIYARQDAARAAGVASPDSWRSLLPEHDPYYASEADTDSLYRASMTTRPTFARDGSRESCGASSYAGCSSSSRRLSNSSMASIQSTFSLPNPSIGKSSRTTSSNRSSALESWRSLLPENDPAACLDTQHEDSTSPRSLEQTTVVGDEVTAGSGLTRSSGTLRASANSSLYAALSPSKRHASFSAFERPEAPINSRGSSDLGHGVQSSDVKAKSPVSPSPLQTSATMSSPRGLYARSEGCASTGVLARPTHKDTLSRGGGHVPHSAGPSSEADYFFPTSSPRSTSRAAMDNAEERESWPVSRISRDLQFLQRARSGDSTQDHGVTSSPYLGSDSGNSDTLAYEAPIKPPPRSATGLVSPAAPSNSAQSRLEPGAKATKVGSSTLSPDLRHSHDVQTPDERTRKLSTQDTDPRQPTSKTTISVLNGSDAGLNEPQLDIGTTAQRHTLSVKLSGYDIKDIALLWTHPQTLHIKATSSTQEVWQRQVRFDKQDLNTFSIAPDGKTLTYSGVKAMFDGDWLVVKVDRRDTRNSVSEQTVGPDSKAPAASAAP